MIIYSGWDLSHNILTNLKTGFKTSRYEQIIVLKRVSQYVLFSPLISQKWGLYYATSFKEGVILPALFDSVNIFGNKLFLYYHNNTRRLDIRLENSRSLKKIIRSLASYKKEILRIVI